MATRLLFSWRAYRPIVHTAVDDLESFLWVLVWVLVHILKEFGTPKGSTVDQLLEMFSSHDISHIMSRAEIVHQGWEDVVFGPLILEWLAISKQANLAIRQLLGTGSGNDIQQGAFNQLEEYCTMVYMQYIQAGQKYLQSIRRYPDWKAVVEKNAG
jgi:hypothetical protein